MPIISRYSKCTVNKDIHFTFTFSKPRFVHGESVKLAWFPAGLLYRVAEVLLVILKIKRNIIQKAHGPRHDENGEIL